MDLPMAIGIFFVVWWLSLFAVLPFWVKTQQENQSIIPGTAESAPVAPPPPEKNIDDHSRFQRDFRSDLLGSDQPINHP